MNNKMTIDNFLKAGGLIEIRLRPELRYLDLECGTYFFATEKTMNNLALRLYSTQHELQKKLRREDILVDMFVENIIFTWNRTVYELEPECPSLLQALLTMVDINTIEVDRFKPYYLIAIGKQP